MKPLIAVPITLLLVYRAYTRKSLTPLGIVTAALTAAAHALHPSALPFTLLCTFFLLGTGATKVKHDVKAKLTLSSSGSSGGEGARTSVQVLANSVCASVLCLLHVYKYGIGSELSCFGGLGGDKISDLILVGIVCNYVSVAADTMSSELGILSKSKPMLITTFHTVPPGTNGGVTFAGLVAGMAGSVAIAATSILLLPFCATFSQDNILRKTSDKLRSSGPWPTNDAKHNLFLAFTLWGTVGTLLDSLLGAILQASVIDRRTGKIVEGTGGVKVLTTASSPSKPVSSSTASTSSSQPKKALLVKKGETRATDHVKVLNSDEKPVGSSRSINSGRDILDNNQVNLLMAATMTVWGMTIAAMAWRIDLTQII